MSCLFTPARSAISATRAPANPLSENSSNAAVSRACRERSASRWRSPAAGERQRDAERSRQALLTAALDEFSLKGFAGARVAEIAERAGVNKQLINYYFGSKEGLY